MARPRSVLPPAQAIMALADAEGRIAIRVSPNASGDAVLLPTDGGSVLVVRTTVIPEDGKANTAVIRLIAKAIDRPASAVELIRGAGSRDNLIRILSTAG